MPQITSRQGLIDYCLRRLGAPMLQINVDDDQLDDRINDAFQYFQEYHSDATMPIYLKHQITAQNITDEYIEVSDDVIYVNRILPFVNAGNSSGSVNYDPIFDVDYQLHLNDIYDLGQVGGLVQYEMVKQYMALIDLKITGRENGFRFSRHTNRIYLDINWNGDVAEGDYIIVDCVRIIDPDQYNEVYNDRYLKDYATELIRYQWGTNLIKFEGMQLPGGVTLNGRQMIEDATANLERLRTEIRENYEMPIDFMIG